MAASPETIAALRRQLADTRTHLDQTTSGLSASLDVPARVRQKVAAHPWKWALLAVAGGVVVARTLPLAVGLIRTAGSRRLVGALLGTVGPMAVRAGLNVLASRRPDLAAFIQAEPPPPPPPDPPAGVE